MSTDWGNPLAARPGRVNPPAGDWQPSHPNAPAHPETQEPGEPQKPRPSTQEDSTLLFEDKSPKERRAAALAAIADAGEISTANLAAKLGVRNRKALRNTIDQLRLTKAIQVARTGYNNQNLWKVLDQEAAGQAGNTQPEPAAAKDGLHSDGNEAATADDPAKATEREGHLSATNPSDPLRLDAGESRQFVQQTSREESVSATLEQFDAPQGIERMAISHDGCLLIWLDNGELIDVDKRTTKGIHQLLEINQQLLG